ncbi:MAG: helical backbone metal receptor [Crocinitomicaceae bacterium]|nr:helical backbone metal receptor [Crocinitomicaceae bacterium]
MNTAIRLEEIPRRIVSLVPSQTQLLHYLGLEVEVIGITKFCIHPDEWFRNKQRVGGTKAVNVERIKELQPDLIIGNKEENTQEDIEALRNVAPVWMSDIFTLEDALSMIESIGEITNRREKAKELLGEIKQEFDSLHEMVKEIALPQNVIYFIWHDPSMTAGSETFIDDMIQKCGWINTIGTERYPTATLDEEVDLVLLSSEPYPFKGEHLEFYQKAYPNAKIVLVDGEMFSWYGAKLKDAPKYFKTLIKQIAVQ